MAKFLSRFDLFSLAAVLCVVSFTFIYWHVFKDHRYYYIFTTEEEINSAKEADFGILSNYL